MSLTVALTTTSPVLKPADDVATANFGWDVRMPTDDEWQELLDNCRSEWTQQNGLYGRRFTGPNGSSLFLPAAGFRYGSELYHAGSYGYYWSASLNESDPDYAWGMRFYSDYQGVSIDGRGLGRSVRAVCSRSQN